MKKLFFYITILSCCALTSCDTESTAGVSDVTYYPVFDLTGGEDYFLPEGQQYTEPGVVATEEGEPVDVSTSFGDGVFKGGSLQDDMPAPDIYHVYYSAINRDGFEGTAARTVVVSDKGDLVNDLSGVYRSTIVRDGVESAQYEDLKYVLIWPVDENTYEISDVVGGYYMYGRGYGINYSGPGMTITVNGPGSYTFGEPVGVGNFGGNAEVTGMTVDADANTIDLSVAWEGYDFEIHLDQVQY